MKIGFSGKICTGKTTACEYLVQKYGFISLRLSDPLKSLEFIHGNVNPESWERLVFKNVKRIVSYLFLARTGEETRAEALEGLLANEVLKAFRLFEPMPSQKNRGLLQYLGTEVGRRLDADIWIDCLVGRIIEREQTGFKHIAVEDVRFPNEFERLKKLGFTMVRLKAGSRVRAKRIEKIYGAYDPEILVHPSELALDGREVEFDYVFDTSGPVEALYRMLDGLMIAGGSELSAASKECNATSGTGLSRGAAERIKAYLQKAFDEVREEHDNTFAFTEEAYEDYVVPLKKEMAELQELIGILEGLEREDAPVGQR